MNCSELGENSNESYIFLKIWYDVQHVAVYKMPPHMHCRYPDEDAGQLPMAFIVRQPGSNLTGQQVMDYVAKHVSFSFLLS